MVARNALESTEYKASEGQGGQNGSLYDKIPLCSALRCSGPRGPVTHVRRSGTRGLRGIFAVVILLLLAISTSCLNSQFLSHYDIIGPIPYL